MHSLQSVNCIASYLIPVCVVNVGFSQPHILPLSLVLPLREKSVHGLKIAMLVKDSTGTVAQHQ